MSAIELSLKFETQWMWLQAMIVCILFFSMDLSTALWTGIIVGAGYTLFVRAMYSQQVRRKAFFAVDHNMLM